MNKTIGTLKCTSCKEYLPATSEYFYRDRWAMKISSREFCYYCKNCRKEQEKRNRKYERRAVNIPHKLKARKDVQIAVQRGILVKPKVCEQCKQPNYVYGHHPDYSKPLDVIWLCRECHTKVHFPLDNESRKAESVNQDRGE